MGLRLITPPAPLFTLAQAKGFLRVVDNDEDDLIAGFVEAATGYAEQYLGRALMDQTWELILDAFPSTTLQPWSWNSVYALDTGAPSTTGAIKILKPPLIEVVSVNYADPDGNTQTMDPADYYVDTTTQPYGWLVPQGSSPSWPATISAINAVTIRYRAGYLDGSSPPAENVPRDIKAAVYLTLGAFYENRQQTVVGTIANRLPSLGVEDILLRHRVDMSMA